jgi:transketolase
MHAFPEIGRYYETKVFQKLLEIKDSDIRISILEQGKSAVDKGIHIGGAFSAVVPLITLYYGNILQYRVDQPATPGQDLFILSKGHGIAALASIYADLGYFPQEVLKNSRSYNSILNGHPGPILPGIHTATGPLGQGICVAEGLALASRCLLSYDVFTLTGDGELQEGMAWEGILFAGTKKLDNFCVLVDKNEGQLDNPKNLLYSMERLEESFKSFGWKVLNADSTQYGPVLNALQEFKFGHRDGRPTVILCHSRKGSGGLSSFMGNHKVDLPDALADQELRLQRIRRKVRIQELGSLLDSFSGKERESLEAFLKKSADAMHLSYRRMSTDCLEIEDVPGPVRIQRAQKRDKKIVFDPEKLPGLDPSRQYSHQEIITAAMKAFAQDPKVASLDADLAGISGLEAGVGFVDQRRALNVGIAEANMMAIGEAFAALGFNTWVSTFCPFFDWKVFRRIAVSFQERIEAMEREDGWLSEGHGLDLTFLATAPDLETKTNGATHMGNDDILVYDGIAHLKIINASCPQQLLSILKWIMEGNRGLVYLRILRTATPVLYPLDFRFQFGKGYLLRNLIDPHGYIVSSGRGVYEALKAAQLAEKLGIAAEVVDMPTVDPELICQLHDSGKPVLIPEQNNGYLLRKFQQVLFRNRREIRSENLVPMNLLDPAGNPRFIHSATYEELLDAYGLTPENISQKLLSITGPA